MKKVPSEIEMQEDLVKSFHPSRIVLPILLGLGVVIYLIWRQFDVEQFQAIKWSGRALFWISLAFLAYILRHLAYAYRLSTLTDWEFSIKKSIELIFIWEFASSVSPTSIGGSAVALFLLAQEKIKGALAIMAVMYSVIIDTLFFVITLPILYFLFGGKIIRPEMSGYGDFNGYGLTFLIVWLFMVFYGILMFYGLIRPRIIRKLLVGVSKIFFLQRFKRDLYNVGQDLMHTSREIQKKEFGFHARVVIATFTAWALRFITVSFIIIAFVESIPMDIKNQIILYARSETMYAITQFSPTPGAAGVSELLFAGFYSDFIPKGIGSIIALIWRLITYYPYLIIGVIVVPNWLNRIIAEKRKEKF